MNPTWRLTDPTHAALRVPAQIAQIGIAGDDAARSMLATHIGREDQRSFDTSLASAVWRRFGRSVGAWDPA
jgi:hypothetical protein